MGNASKKIDPPTHQQVEQPLEPIDTPNKQIQTPTEETPAEVIDRQIEEQEQMQEEEVEQPLQVDTEHHKEQIIHLQIPQNIQTNTALLPSPRQPLTARSQLSQQVTIDREKTAKILKDLIVQAIPVAEVKQVKLSQRKKLMIGWLKQGASVKKEQERDAVLRENGYQVFSTRVLSQLYQKYEECSRKWLKLTTIIIFSYSSYYNNEETVKQLYQYFILKGKSPKIFIVKPIDQSQYRLQFNSIKANPAISELSYQIQYIRHKISEYQVSQPANTLNFIPLKYWEGKKGIMQIYHDSSIYEAFITRCKVSLAGCLKVGFTLVEELQEKNHFKEMLKKYAFFHDLYLSQSLLMKEINKNEHFLKRIGLKLLEDPINFYLNPTHQIAINRLIKYCTDVPQCLNNVILPLNLLYYKIIEEHRKENRSKRYKNQFIGYYPTILNDEELSHLQKETVFENLGFIKANLKQLDLKQGHFEGPSNVLFIIRVHPVQREEDSDKGYVFVGKSAKDISEENEQNEAYNYQGFSYVLFNLFNTFFVIDKHYDSSIKKHIIELQYGYVSAQLQKRNYVNFISKEENVPHALKKHHDTKIDYEAIIKYQSNTQVINKITDFGDSLSLLSKFNEAVSYYDSIFAKCKTQMSHDVLLLSNFQNKKGLNLQLGKSSQTALQYFYNAYNFIRKSKIYTQIQLNVMRCLEGSHQYQKMISFGENLIEIAKKHNFINEVPRELLLQLYQLIARGYQMKNMTNYQLKTISKHIMKSYELGLQVVEEMGQLNEKVSDFYYSLGRYHLINRSSLESLLYLNKSLLIKKSILTENHPSLCPLYEILAAAYVCMHDYSQALNSINSAYFLYLKYYEKTNNRFIVVYQLRGKIFALLNKILQALSSFQQEKKLLFLYEQKKKFKVEMERKYILKNERIALFNLVEEKQLNPYFCYSFRKDKSQICMVFVLLYQSHLNKLHYNYSNALLLLQEAHKLNNQELGQANILNLQMFFLTSDLLIDSYAWDKAENVLKNFFGLLTKLRKSNEPEAARYYEQLGKLYESKKDYKNCLKNLGKTKEILFRVYGRQSLENCRLSSKIGNINLLVDNLHDSKIYFSQGQKALSQMLLRLKNDPQSFNLAGNDLPKFKRNVEISYSESIENKGMLQQKSNNYNDAIKLFKEAIESYKANLGEYNPKVANVYFRIAQCHFNKGGDEIDFAIRQALKSLQIYKAADDHNLNNRVDIYLLLAKLYECKNQQIKTIEELGNALNCLNVMKKVGEQFHTILKEISRVIDIVIAFPAINNLKNAYFVIARLIASEKDQIAQILRTNKSALSAKILSELELISQKEDEIRRLIENIQTQEQKEQKMLALRLQEKDKRITLDKIKQNLQIRKKLRLKTT